MKQDEGYEAQPCLGPDALYGKSENGLEELANWPTVLNKQTKRVISKVK